jgi:hypothetical protein
MTIVVAPELVETEYARWQGALNLPERSADRPATDALETHRNRARF